MRRHLTVREIGELAAVKGAPEVDAEVHAHLDHCKRCRRELLQLQDALHDFGAAVRTWSEREARGESDSPRRSVPGLVSFMGAISSIVVLALLLSTYSGRRIHVAPPVDRAQPISDVALLDQIQTDISRPVPIRLEPLLVLVNGGSPRRDLTR